MAGLVGIILTPRVGLIVTVTVSHTGVKLHMAAGRPQTVYVIDAGAPVVGVTVGLVHPLVQLK
jgi:hypothetical protein